MAIKSLTLEFPSRGAAHTTDCTERLNSQFNAIGLQFLTQTGSMEHDDHSDVVTVNIVSAPDFTPASSDFLKGMNAAEVYFTASPELKVGLEMHRN